MNSPPLKTVHRIFEKMGPSEPEAIEMSADIEAEGTDDASPFSCGVVEGELLMRFRKISL